MRPPVQADPFWPIRHFQAARAAVTFNFRRQPNGWTCGQTQAPRDSKRIWPLFGDNGEPRKVRADKPDPMQVGTNCVTIVNDLPERFYDGRVRFLLPKGTYGAARNGVILSEYDSADGALRAVLVKVDIPAEGRITVSLPVTPRAGS